MPFYLIHIYSSCLFPQKFNEKNCWSFPIRDSLVFYERRQENSMSSLIKAGSLAEACTKIYGFRVDSVYNNVKSTYLRLKENNDGKDPSIAFVIPRLL